MTNYFNPTRTNAYRHFGTCLSNILISEASCCHSFVLLCIGTDRVTGDCLGPLVGQQLTSLRQKSCTTTGYDVYGTLETPVHALNLSSCIDQIYNDYSSPYIIAIDASLGSANHVGYITLSTDPLYPGQGIHKKIPAIGSLSITGIVGSSNPPQVWTLQNTRLYSVIRLAGCISAGIHYGFEQFHAKKHSYSSL